MTVLVALVVEAVWALGMRGVDTLVEAEEE